MRIPDRQPKIDALTRKYLRDLEPNNNGHALRPPKPATVAGLANEQILDLCRKAKNAAKFSDLYDAGNTAAYDDDESSADLALISMLKFYTQDPAQLEQLFDASALGQRPKWKNRPDYRRRTIDKALENLGETYTPPRSRSQSLSNTGVSYDGGECRGKTA